MKERTAQDVILETVDKHMYSAMVDSCHRPGVYYPGRIGEAIKRLSETDRKLLENLTSEDFKDVRPLEYAANHIKPSTTRIFRIPHEKP